MKIKRICQNCAKIFETPESEIKKGGGKFCSRKCLGEWMSRNRRGEKHPSWKGGKIERRCQICGKIFYVFSTRIKHSKCNFCSRNCYLKWKIENTNSKGKNNPNWRGGISLKNMLIRCSLKYKQWRQQCFIRDNFTCQKCKKQGGKLHAHHKKPFYRLLQEIKTNLPLLDLYEGAMIYTPLWDVSNGITLCEKCHKKTKNYFKRKKNTNAVRSA